MPFDGEVHPDSLPEFGSPAEEAVYTLFLRGFGTCRSSDGEYSVIFRFGKLDDAQRSYEQLCRAYMHMVRKEDHK